jgi:hypothetical protein
MWSPTYRTRNQNPALQTRSLTISQKLTEVLTPKGLNVRTADKPVLVYVTWAHTIFRFFETFSEHASCSKLHGKKKPLFWTYGSKVMDVWSFKEKSGQGGHVLQPMRKSWPLAQKVEGRKKKNFNKNRNSPTGPSVDLRPAGNLWSPAQGQLATSGRPPAAGRHLDLLDCPNFFEIFLFLKNEFLEVREMGQGFWKNGCTAPPFFEACPYTWKW